MNLNREQLWDRFQKHYLDLPALGLAVDVSRLDFQESFLDEIKPAFDRAFDRMAALEKGEIANPDENRRVGHYWLRTPELAPDASICRDIESAVRQVNDFAARVHAAEIRGNSGPFRNLLVIGIGGSALGPQFVSSALGHPKRDWMKVFFFDNTDPDGMDRVLAALDGQLDATLVVVISKSGGTKETRNGMIEAGAAFERAGLSFARHAVAITQVGSQLDQRAVAQGWIARFPMWDWVGGRTSETSVVGLLPAALQGIDVEALLQGARACDAATRVPDLRKNPAALLAAMWFYAGNGKGAKDMVVLPYKDRLELFSRYLQQLIMESLGKEKDLDGAVVNQGIAVYGNKGSTDQHAYVQQLRDGISNFFVTFIEVLRDREGPSMRMDPHATSGDYLQGFFLGTRHALAENNRGSITLTLTDVNPFAVGVLIALFERAVGLYAWLININAYHQPGVEAGKKAAEGVLKLEAELLQLLESHRGEVLSLGEIVPRVSGQADSEMTFKILEHLCANPDRGVTKIPGPTPFSAHYRFD